METMINTKFSPKSLLIALIFVKICLLMIAIFAVIDGYALWQYQAEHPETRYEYDLYSPTVEIKDGIVKTFFGPPPELEYKLSKMADIRNYLLWGVLLGVVYLYIEHLQGKPSIFKQVKKFIDKAKETEFDEDEE